MRQNHVAYACNISPHKVTTCSQEIMSSIQKITMWLESEHHAATAHKTIVALARHLVCFIIVISQKKKIEHGQTDECHCHTSVKCVYNCKDPNLL